MSPSRPTRSRAEWFSLVVSAGVVLVVVGLIVVQIPGTDQTAAPTARVQAVRVVGDSFHVEVIVHNDGDPTAANVQVLAELIIDGDELTGDQTIDFLSGGEDQHLSFIFDEDPASGDSALW